MKDYNKYDVWQLSMNLVEDIYVLLDNLPNSEKYGLKSQMSRAAVSIPANIAEGSAKTSQKDFKRFLEISLGSSFELETLLLIVKMREWLDVIVVDKMLNNINNIERKLGALIKVINKDLKAKS